MGSYWFSDKIVLRMYRAAEVGPDHQLYRIVERLTARANLPMPKVYVIPDASPNAFATGRNPAARRRRGHGRHSARAQRTELEGVIAHELAHVQAPRHPDQLRRGDDCGGDHDGGAMAHSRRCSAARRPRRSRTGTNPIALLATMIFAPIAAMLIQMAISRSREFAADAGGAAIAGNPYGLAERAAEDRRDVEAGAARRQPGNRAHVHHQAVLRRRSDVALQQPSPDRSAHRALLGTPLRKSAPLVGGGAACRPQSAALRGLATGLCPHVPPVFSRLALSSTARALALLLLCRTVVRLAGDGGRGGARGGFRYSAEQAG